MSNDFIISGLNPVAAQAARDFLAKFPDAILTSGRRSVQSQAAAVAADVVQDPGFIAKTYRHDPITGQQCAVAAALQCWIEASIECVAVDGITIAFEKIMGRYSQEELEKFSFHMGGNAFDVHPDGDAAKSSYLIDLAAERNAAGGRAEFLSKEAGLVRWHWQGV